MAVVRVGVDLRGRADLGAEAVAGGVIAVAVNDSSGDTIGEAGQAAQRVVAQADLRCGVACGRQCGEVAGRVEAEADVQPARAGVLDGLRAVVQIVLAGEGAAIAVGPAGSRAERVVSGIAQQHLPATAGGRHADLRGLALCIAHVIDDCAIRIGHAAQLAADGVVITQHQRGAVAGLYLAHQIAEAVVAILGDGAAVLHLGQATDRKRFAAGASGLRHVVGVGDVEAGGGVGDLGQAIERVIAVGGGVAARIGLGGAVAGAVVGVAGDAGVRAGELHQLAEAVVVVGGVQPLGVGDLGQVVECVVGELRVGLDAGDILQRVREAIERVVLALRRGCQRIGHFGGVAVGVVREVGRVAGGGGLGLELAELVVHARERALQRGGRVLGVFLDAIAGVVQRVVDGIARVVGDIGQPMRRIVGEGSERAIGLGDLPDQAGGPVVDAGDAVIGLAGRIGPAHLAGGQPTARVIGVVGDDAIGVLDGQRTACAVVGEVFGGLAEGVGDFPSVAFAMRARTRRCRATGVVGKVVGVAGAIRDIRACAIAGQQQAGQGTIAGSSIAVFAVALGGDAGRTSAWIRPRYGQCLTPAVVGPARPCDQNITGIVGAPVGGHTETGVPVRLQRALLAAAAVVRFDLAGQQATVVVPPISGDACKIDFLVGVAVAVVAARFERPNRAFGAQALDGGNLGLAKLGDASARYCIAERIGDCGSVPRVGNSGLVDLAGRIAMHAAYDALLRIVGPRGIHLVLLIAVGGQCIREARIAIVIPGDSRRHRSGSCLQGHRPQSRLGVVAVGQHHSIGESDLCDPVCLVGK